MVLEILLICLHIVISSTTKYPSSCSWNWSTTILCRSENRFTMNYIFCFLRDCYSFQPCFREAHATYTPGARPTWGRKKLTNSLQDHLFQLHSVVVIELVVNTVILTSSIWPLPRSIRIIFNNVYSPSPYVVRTQLKSMQYISNNGVILEKIWQLCLLLLFKVISIYSSLLFLRAITKYFVNHIRIPFFKASFISIIFCSNARGII
jgi:hypothetical protein